MANRDKLSWLSKSTSSSELQLQIHGMPFAIDKELLAGKSAKVAALLKQNADESLFNLFRDMPANPETLEIVARFCHGYEPNLSADNVISVTCVAFYLGMTETLCKDNLLPKALAFFRHIVLPSWNETLKAFHSISSNFKPAKVLGLFDACLESLVAKVLADPRLLGEPVRNSAYNKYSDEEEAYMPNARRRLFVLDWKSEDVTTLPLQLYEPLIHEMNQHDVSPEYVAASLCQYTKNWVFVGESMSIFRRNSLGDVIEAVERLLPLDRGLVPCTLLFKMLSYAISLECSDDCINGFESRIGKQLDQATVKDILILSEGRSKEDQYEMESLRRILKHFYGNYSSSDDSTGLFSVAELVEEFLIEVASDIDLKTDTFVSLAEMSNSTSLGVRNSDGMYRAIDIYLDRHNHLTELEREEVCRVLDFRKMSPEASEHAAKNERLPLRFVVQVLFMHQVQLRNLIPKEVQNFADRLRIQEGKEEEGNDAKASLDEDVIRNEMDKMSIKVIELENECNTMRKEIENGCSSNHQLKKEKTSMWKEMKRKFGCISSIPDCNCQVKKKKKVHPKF